MLFPIAEAKGNSLVSPTFQPAFSTPPFFLACFIVSPHSSSCSVSITDFKRHLVVFFEKTSSISDCTSLSNR